MRLWLRCARTQVPGPSSQDSLQLTRRTWLWDVQKHLELPSGTLTGPEGPRGCGEGTREQSAVRWVAGGRTAQVPYLGGQRLPVPQPAHCRPGLAGGRARPVEIGTDVSLPI